MTISHVQKIGSATGNGISPVTITPTLATTAGNAILVSCTWYPTAGTGGTYPAAAVSDSAGNTYTTLYSVTGSASTGPSLLVAVAYNASPVHTSPGFVEVTFTGGTAYSIFIADEWSGLGGTQDGSSLVGQGSSQAIPFGTLTTSNASDLVYVSIGCFGNLSATSWSSGWSSEFQSASPTLSLGWQIASSAGSFSGTATLQVSEIWRSVMIALEGASSGGAAVPAPKQPPPVLRRTAPRAVWAQVTGPANAYNPAGTVQPRAAVPVPRRASARAVWARITGPANAAPPPPSGTVQPRAAVPVPRRASARAVWARITGPANAYNPAGTVQPRATVPVPRRAAARAVRNRVAGTAAAVIIPGAPGTVQPPATAPARRRPAARAAWRSVTGPANAAVPPPAGSVQPYPAQPSGRRYPSRAVIRGRAVPPVQPVPATGGSVARHPHGSRGTWRGVTGTIAGHPVTGGTACRRPPSRTGTRALWHGRAVAAAAPFPVTGGTVTRHRAAARGTWTQPPPAGLPLAFVAVPAPKQVPLAPRRTGTRVLWHGIAGTVAPPVPPAGGPVLIAGGSRLKWDTGDWRENWAAGGGRPDWAAAEERANWQAGGARNQ